MGGSKSLNSRFIHCRFIVTGIIVISREQKLLAKLLQFDPEAFPILDSREHGKGFYHSLNISGQQVISAWFFRW